MHEKTSILKTERKIQKYEQRKIIDKRDKKPNKNRYKKMMRERERKRKRGTE